MNAKFYFLLLLSALSYSSIQANETTESAPKSTASPHTISVGPDLFWMHYNFPHLKSNGFYGGLQATYDYVQPNSIYFGAEGLYALGRTTNEYQRWGGIDQFKDDSKFAHLEGRIGYTFLPKVDLQIVPFVGLGWYYNHNHSTNHPDFRFEELSLTENIAYYAAGLRMMKTFNRSFDFGVNLKGMESFLVRENYEVTGSSYSYQYHHQWRNRFGYEIGLPCVFHPGKSKNWNIQLEPYFLELPSGGREFILGGRFLAGYRF